MNRSRQERATSRGAVVALVCRLITGAIFVYASVDKLAHPQEFAQAVFNYHLIPIALLHPFALALPAVEATVGLALLLGFLRRGGALLACAMTLMFTVAVAFALARGLDISCGCFETENGAAVGLDLLLRDLALLVIAAVPLLSPHPGWGVVDLTSKPLKN